MTCIEKDFDFDRLENAPNFKFKKELIPFLYDDINGHTKKGIYKKYFKEKVFNFLSDSDFKKVDYLILDKKNNCLYLIEISDLKRKINSPREKIDINKEKQDFAKKFRDSLLLCYAYYGKIGKKFNYDIKGYIVVDNQTNFGFGTTFRKILKDIDIETIDYKNCKELFELI